MLLKGASAVYPLNHSLSHDKEVFTNMVLHSSLCDASFIMMICSIICIICVAQCRDIMKLPWDIMWGGWGCEVSCGGHHRLRGKTTMGSAWDGAVFDIAQILAYLVHNMSWSQLYLGFGHFGWLPSFFGQYHFGGLMVKLYFLCWNYSLSSGWHIIAA